MGSHECGDCGTVYSEKRLVDESGQLTARCLDGVCGGNLKRFDGLLLGAISDAVALEIATVLIPEDLYWGEGSRQAAVMERELLVHLITNEPALTRMKSLTSVGERMFCSSIHPEDVARLIGDYNDSHCGATLQRCEEIQLGWTRSKQEYIDRMRPTCERYNVGFFISMLSDSCLARNGKSGAEHRQKCKTREACLFEQARSLTLV